MHTYKLIFLALAMLAQFAVADVWDELASFKGTTAKTAPPTVVEDLIVSTPADKMGPIEAKLIGIVTSPEATVEAKRFACRMLQRVGTETCVSAVQGLLGDAQMAHYARLVLERLPESAVAGDALVEALDSAADGAKAGILSSIGVRGDVRSTAAVAAYAGSDNAAHAAAALQALGMLGGEAARDALVAVDLSPSPALQATRDGALIVAADGLKDAKTLARIYGATKAEGVRMAALRALIRADEAQAVPIVSGLIAGEDSRVRNAALSALGRDGGAALTAAAVATLGTLPTDRKLVVIAVLGQRGDATAIPGIQAYVEAEDAAVGEAALMALAALGDGTTVPILLDYAEGSRKTAALEALQAMTHPTTNGSLIVELQNNDRSVAACDALARRAAKEAKPALKALTTHADPLVQRAAWSALGATATIADLDELMTQALSIEDAKTARMVYGCVRAVSAVATDKNACIEAVGRHYESADQYAKMFILDLAAAGGSSKGIEYAKSALASGDEKLYNKAVRSLAAWFEPGPAIGELLNLARNAPEEKNRILALRGYLTLAGKEQNATKALKWLKDGRELVQRAEDKRLLIAGTDRGKNHKLIELIYGYTEDAEVSAEARLVVFKMADLLHRRKRPVPAEAITALKLIVADPASDAATVKRSKEILEKAASTKAPKKRIAEKKADIMRNWQLAGPFSGAEKLFLHAFIPETAAGEVTWREVTDADFSGDQIDFMKTMKGANRVAYVKTVIPTKRARTARLELGSDDGVKVWLNGTLVHEKDARRECKIGDDVLSLSLVEGQNQLLVKIVQYAGNWGFGARLALTP